MPGKNHFGVQSMQRMGHQLKRHSESVTNARNNFTWHFMCETVAMVANKKEKKTVERIGENSEKPTEIGQYDKRQWLWHVVPLPSDPIRGSLEV